MKVLKFGGSSVGSPERMKKVADLICASGDKNVIVLSAMSGTTNTLSEIATYLYNKNADGAIEVLNELESKYMDHVEKLFETDQYRKTASDYLNEIFTYLRIFSKQAFSQVEEKIILAQGELLSTHLMTYYLQERGVDVALISALDFMRINMQGEPDNDFIRENVRSVIASTPADVYITQGFICKNMHGDIDNLKRGGSDYTASLLGASLDAEEIEIWTDIDGMHNNDPRIVEGTTAVHHLHFEEAAELGYFGAKILHPTCILPAKLAHIPVRLKNTMDPSSEGTLIDNKLDRGEIKAVAAKDNIAAIKIKSSRMLLAHGFLRKVFEIFESYQTSIDMICTSEVGVSMSIDDTSHINEIIHDLKKYGTVSVDLDMCIICVVGDMDWSNLGFESKVVNALKDIPVRMVSYGGSNYNISFLVREDDKKQALRQLSRIFDKEA